MTDNSSDLLVASAKTKSPTMAELDAQERYDKLREGCTRRSARQVNNQRISTSQLWRLDQLFWQGDTLYNNDQETTTSSNDNDDEMDAPPKKKHGLLLKNPMIGNHRKLQFQKVHDSPHIYVMDHFLSETELDFFDKKLISSKTNATTALPFQTSFLDTQDTSESSSGSLVEQEQRTSTFVQLDKLENSKIASIERRAAELLGVSVETLEPLQLVRYQQGQFFGIHHDLGVLYEDGSVELPPKQPWCRRRIVTIFCYLNNVDCGGCTCFPLLKRDGLRVQPKRGRAVLFCNIDKHGMPDPRTVHAGEPVLCNNDEKKKYENCGILTRAARKRQQQQQQQQQDREASSKDSTSPPPVKYGINIWACEA